MTVFGDMTAALAGKRFGRIRPAVFGGKKSREGAGAALIVNLTIWIVLLRAGAAGHPWQGIVHGTISLDSSFGHTLWPVVVAMAVVATTVELTISKIKDNLTIPVISGFAGQLTMLL
jgi:dolichol kinase